MTAPEDFVAARYLPEAAPGINPEKSGGVPVFREIALLQGDGRTAAEYLEAACRTNPRAAGGFFLRSYIARKRGAVADSEALLLEARDSGGPEWKPVGSTAEGDVDRRMHGDETPLSRFWNGWNGDPDPAAAFAGPDAWIDSVATGGRQG